MRYQWSHVQTCKIICCRSHDEKRDEAGPKRPLLIIALTWMGDQVRRSWVQLWTRKSVTEKRILTQLIMSERKNQHFPNSNSTRKQVDEEPLRGCATSKSLLLLLLNVSWSAVDRWIDELKKWSFFQFISQPHFKKHFFPSLSLPRDSKSHEKMETMFMQNFGGTNKEYYGIFESGY